jgi:RecA/RadA recombinase
MSELATDEQGRVIYQIDGPTLQRFMLSAAPVEIICGPIGSGKTTAAMLKLWAVANAQRPAPDGVRRTRMGVVRTTYPELRTTTIRSWTDTFPPQTYGAFRWTQPPCQTVVWGDVSMQVDFLALDDPTDVQKLRSGEYTAFLVNELQYLGKELFDEMTSRAGRYPAVKDGGPTWHGVIADMNVPDQDHWLALMRGMVPWPEGMLEDERNALAWPATWEFFEQPPGLLEVRGDDGAVIGYDDNPAAENLKWLPKNYYGNLIAGKSRAWIKSRILNQVALVVDGEPVWPAFRRELHVAKDVLHAVPGHPIWIGADFGRSPAVLFGQAVNNRVTVLDEMQGHNVSAVTFAPQVKRRLEQKYPGFTFVAYGDPKGQDKTQSDERTAYDIFRSHGIDMKPAPVKMNLIETRIAAVDYLLGQLYDGRPRLQISPSCRTLIAGLEGGYCYERKLRSSEIKTEPAKNRFSHLADALQYLALAMGEGRAMMGLTPVSELKPMRIWRGRRTMRRIVA